MVRVIILGYNAHRNCSEGVARITFNMFHSLRSSGVEAYLVSIIDPSFENTFAGTRLYGEIFLLHRDDDHERVLQVIRDIISLSREDAVVIVNTLGPLERIVQAMRIRLISKATDVNVRIMFSLFSRPFKLYEKLSYLSADKILVYSPSEYLYIRRRVPFLVNRVALIPVPIDTDLFAPRDKKASRKLVNSVLDTDLDPDTIVIGYLGNPFPDRLPLITFRVFKRLAEKFDLTMVIIAPPYARRSLVNRFNSIREMYGLKSKLIYVEKFVDYDLRPYIYSSFDIYIHPYTWEEAPYPFLTVLEAMSVGLPVVVTNTNEYKWISLNGTYAFLIDVHNIGESMYQALLKIIVSEYYDNSSFRLSVRKRVEELFSLKKAGLYLRSLVERSWRN